MTSQTPSSAAQPVRSARASALNGRLRVPGDKSISHRALIFGLLTIGETPIEGLLEAEDVLHTMAAVRAFGAGVMHGTAPGSYTVRGRGIGNFDEPDQVLDMGNSGTAARLLMGVAATVPIRCFFTGDKSLVKRPMGRVTEPLSRMGAQFEDRGGRLPLCMTGARLPVPIAYTLPVASAQVKSAILLAALNTPGRTTVIEPVATRDHTENMLRAFGANVVIEDGPDGRQISLDGHPELIPARVIVPGDPSSAAFPLVAALITEGSDLVIENVGMNPLRTGLFKTLMDMGADLTFQNERLVAGEPVADIAVKHSRLKGIEVPAERAASMIDEYPVLSVAAAFADGPTHMPGIGELRVKESDRLAMMAAGLEANGVTLEAGQDYLTVTGTGGPPKGGARVETALDHRIAMSFLTMGCGAQAAITVDDIAPVNTSFPGFTDLLNEAGAKIEPM